MRNLITVFLLLNLSITSCGWKSPTEAPAMSSAIETGIPATATVIKSYRLGTWVRQTPFQWTHDGLPYESEHFIIYSDGARQEEKARFAEEAEQSLTFILDTLHLSEDELSFPPAGGKIEVFGSTEHSDELGGGFAYYVGFLFTYDPGEYLAYQSSSPDSFMFGPLFTHEITHDVAFMLLGYGSHNSMLVSTWFDEGLATYVAEDDPYLISSLSQFTYLIQTLEDVPGQGNPTLIQLWEEIPPQYFNDEMMSNLYALFEMAVRYLVDTYGVETCKQLYLGVRDGMTFEEAFESQYGMSLNDYQHSFFSLMEGYLR